MAKLFDTDTFSWLPFNKPLQNPYVKIKLTKKLKENLNQRYGIPWAKVNEIPKNEAYFYLARRNGKSDAFNALVYALSAYEKIKEKEMKNERTLVIDVNDIRKFNITYPDPGIPIYTCARGIANIEVEMAANTINKIRMELEEKKRARVREYVDSRPNGRNRPEIEKVIFNPPATIVIWHDKSKTIVKCRGDDEYDPEYGLAMCIAKKYFGSRHQMQKLVAENYEEPDYTNINPEEHEIPNLGRLARACRAFSDALTRKDKSTKDSLIDVYDTITLNKEVFNDAKDENKTADSSVNSGNPDDHWDSDKIWGQTE